MAMTVVLKSKYYRDRADEVRAISDHFTTIACKTQMQRLAVNYDKEARRAEAEEAHEMSLLKDIR